MTRPVCLIGNSHLAALKHAWTDVQDQFPGLCIEMYGAHSDHLIRTALRGGRIVPTTERGGRNFEMSAGRRVIELPRYAVFYVIGAGFTPLVLYRVYEWHGYFGLKGKRPHLVSQRCFRQAALASLHGSAALHLVRMIRKVSAAPVYVCAQPMPSEACLEDPNFEVGHREAMASGDDGELFDVYLEICRELAAEGIVFIQQPDSTKSAVALTKRLFCQGAKSLFFSTASPDTDYRHMNGHYGAIVLGAMFAELGTDT